MYAARRSADAQAGHAASELVKQAIASSYADSHPASRLSAVCTVVTLVDLGAGLAEDRRRGNLRARRAGLYAAALGLGVTWRCRERYGERARCREQILHLIDSFVSGCGTPAAGAAVGMSGFGLIGDAALGPRLADAIGKELDHERLDLIAMDAKVGEQGVIERAQRAAHAAAHQVDGEGVV